MVLGFVFFSLCGSVSRVARPATKPVQSQYIVETVDVFYKRSRIQYYAYWCFILNMFTTVVNIQCNSRNLYFIIKAYLGLPKTHHSMQKSTNCSWAIANTGCFFFFFLNKKCTYEHIYITFFIHFVYNSEKVRKNSLRKHCRKSKKLHSISKVRYKVKAHDE